MGVAPPWISHLTFWFFRHVCSQPGVPTVNSNHYNQMCRHSLTTHTYPKTTRCVLCVVPSAPFRQPHGRISSLFVLPPPPPVQMYEFSLNEERVLRGLTEASSTAGLALGLQATVTLLASEYQRHVLTGGLHAQVQLWEGSLLASLPADLPDKGLTLSNRRRSPVLCSWLVVRVQAASCSRCCLDGGLAPLLHVACTCASWLLPPEGPTPAA